MRRFLLLVLAGIAALWGLYAWVRAQEGFSARTEPSAIERLIARGLRRAAVSADARAARSPFPASQEVLAEGRAHFADHCASCHANNGSGDTTIGRNLYPRAPDMRKPDTQSLTDGELYWIIHNGIRFSGMAAWGGVGHDEDSWKLVAFIRHLPALTPEEESAMERLNRKSSAEIEEEEQDRRFLAGRDEPVKKRATSKRKQP